MEGLELRRELDGVDWEEAARMIAATPLGARDPDRLERAFRGSYAACFAFRGKALAGCGRAISDGITQAALYDMAVRPDEQGAGVGRLLLHDLLERLSGQTVILFAAPGVEPFYRQEGFETLLTGMGRFPHPEVMRKLGYLE